MHANCGGTIEKEVAATESSCHRSEFLRPTFYECNWASDRQNDRPPNRRCGFGNGRSQDANLINFAAKDLASQSQLVADDDYLEGIFLNAAEVQTEWRVVDVARVVRRNRSAVNKDLGIALLQSSLIRSACRLLQVEAVAEQLDADNRVVKFDRRIVKPR